MKALLTAIYGKYAAGTALRTACYVSAAYPGLYNDRVPVNAPFPYCVFGLHVDNFDDTMTDNFDLATVYFNVYSQTSGAAAMDLVTGVKAIYDGAALTVTGYDPLYMLRDSILPVHDFSDDTPVWGWAIHYDVLLES